MKQKGFAPLIVLLLIVGIGIVAASFFVGSKGIFNKLPALISSPTPSSTPDVTANWKTYTNTKYNYSLRYPIDYTVGQNGVNSPTPETVGWLIVYKPSNASFSEEPVFTVSLKEGSDSLEKMAQDHFNKLSKYVFQPNTSVGSFRPENNKVVVPLTKITFFGNTAYTYTISGSYVEDGAAESVSIPMNRKYIWTENGANIFLIRADDKNPTNQILSTFKFLSVSQNLTTIKNACITLEGSTKNWDSIYKECNEGGATKEQLQTFCSTYSGKFEDNVDVCRHATGPCGPSATYTCSFANQ